MSDGIAARQTVYLNFNGGTADYDGEILTVTGIAVKDSGLSDQTISQVISVLNTRYAGLGVTFTADHPPEAENGTYSTIHIGQTDAFDPYGQFLGLSETVDAGNRITDDDAFVMLDSGASPDLLIDTIDHETGHLIGVLDHGGEGLNRYACTFDFGGELTQAMYDYIIANNSHYGGYLQWSDNSTTDFIGIYGPDIDEYGMIRTIDFYSLVNIGALPPRECDCTVYIGDYPIGRSGRVETYHTYTHVNGVTLNGADIGGFGIFRVGPGGVVENSTVNGGLVLQGAGATARNVLVTDYFSASEGAVIDKVTVLNSGNLGWSDVTISDTQAPNLNTLILSGNLTVNRLSLSGHLGLTIDSDSTGDMNDVAAHSFHLTIAAPAGSLAIRNLTVNGGGFWSEALDYSDQRYPYSEYLKQHYSIENLTLLGKDKGFGLFSDLSVLSVAGTVYSEYKSLMFRGGETTCDVTIGNLPQQMGTMITYQQIVADQNAHFGNLNFSLGRNLQSSYRLFYYVGLDDLPESYRPFNTITVSGLPDGGKIVEEKFGNQYIVTLKLDAYCLNYDDIVVREGEAFDYDLPGNAFHGWSNAEVEEYTLTDAPDFVKIDGADGSFEPATVGSLWGDLFGLNTFVVKAKKIIEDVVSYRDLKVEMVVVPQVITGLNQGSTDLVEEAVRHLQDHTASFQYSSPKTEFDLFGLNFTIEAAKVKVSNKDSNYLLSLNGKFGLKLKGKTVVVDLSGEDGGGNPRKLDLLVKQDFSSAEFLSVNASLSVDKFSLFGFTFSEVSLSVDSGTKAWAGAGKVKLPGVSFELGGAIGFAGGSFDYLQLGISNINKPIGVTGAFLQSVAGKVANLSPKAEKPVQVEGEIGFTYGPELTLDLPDWLPVADGDYSLLEITVTGIYSDEAISGKGAAKVLGDFGSASVEGELNLASGTLSFAGEFTLLGGAIKVTGKMSGSAGSVTVSGTGEISVPGYGPFAARKFTGNAVLGVTDNSTNADDYLMAWGKTTVMDFEMVYGFKLTLDGGFKLLGAKDCTAPAGSPVRTAMAGEAPAGGSWIITGQDEVVLFSADWTGAGATITLTGPDSTVYTLADIACRADMKVVDELTSDNAICIAVKNAAAGTWQLTVEGVSGVSAYVDALRSEDRGKPQLISVTPDAQTRSVSIVCSVSAAQVAAGVGVYLYADNDNFGYDGVLVGGGAMTAEAGVFNWTMPEGLQGGNYYFYSVAAVDGIEPVLGDYTAEAVTLASGDLTPPEVPEGLSAVRAGDGVKLQWSAAFDNAGVTGYLLRYGTAEDLADAVTLPLAELSTVLSGLAEGNYFWQVCALDAAGNASEFSELKRFVWPLDPATRSNAVLTDYLELAAGESGEDLAVTSGGILVVGSEARAERVAIGSGGKLVVDALGSVSSAIISSGGTAEAYVGAHLAALSVESGGRLTIDVGEGWINTTVAYLDGTLAVAGQLILNKELDASDGNLILRAEGLGVNNAAPLVVNLERLRRGTVTLTVAADQATGRYLIAGGAGAFGGNITIDNGVNAPAGLAVNGVVELGDRSLSLKLLENSLYLTVVGDDRVLLYAGSELVAGGDGVAGLAIGGSAAADRMEILSGGTASAATVSSGGIQNVQAGGTAVATAVLGGGTQSVAGFASATTVSSGGIQHVQTGAGALATTVLGGTQNVAGFASANSVAAGGLQLLTDGGSAIATVVSADGSQHVLSGATASGTVLSGGIQLVSSGGSANGTLVETSGRASVAAGGVLTGLTVAGGGMAEIAGTLENGSVSSGGTLEFQNGSVLSGILEIGGGEVTAPGPISVAAGTELRLGLDWQLCAGEATVLGSLDDFAGAAFSLKVKDLDYQGYYHLSELRSVDPGLSMTVFDGDEHILGMVTVGGGSLRAGDYFYTLFNQNSGVWFCISGAADPAPYGKVVLSSGGIPADGADFFSGITLGNGEIFDAAEIGSGGMVTSGRITSGGTVAVRGDGSFTASEVLCGGTVTVDQGGMIGDLFIDAGATLNLNGNTAISSDLLIGGRLIAGGTLEGGWDESGLSLTLALDRLAAATAEPLIDDWTRLDFSGELNIRIAEDQAAGNYRLLGGINGNQPGALTVTIGDEAESQLLFPGDKLYGDSTVYALEQIDAELVFSVTAIELNRSAFSVGHLQQWGDAAGTVFFLPQDQAADYQLSSGGNPVDAEFRRDEYSFAATFEGFGGGDPVLITVSAEDGTGVELAADTLEVKLAPDTSPDPAFNWSASCNEGFYLIQTGESYDGESGRNTVRYRAGLLANYADSVTVTLSENFYLQAFSGRTAVFGSDQGELEIYRFDGGQFSLSGILDFGRIGAVCLSADGGRMAVGTNIYSLSADGHTWNRDFQVGKDERVFYLGGNTLITSCGVYSGTGSALNQVGQFSGLDGMRVTASDRYVVSLHADWSGEGGVPLLRLTGYTLTAGGWADFVPVSVETPEGHDFNALQLTVKGDTVALLYNLDGSDTRLRVWGFANGRWTQQTDLDVAYNSILLADSERFYTALGDNLTQVYPAAVRTVVTSPAGNAAGIHWEASQPDRFLVEYSCDNFVTALRIRTTGTGLETILAAGSYRWRVRAENGDDWVDGGAFSVSATSAPARLSAAGDGVPDLWLARSIGTWRSSYAACHAGIRGEWSGTGEKVEIANKNRFADLTAGSGDPNLLNLSDDAAGDALFLDDIYTALPGGISVPQSRLAAIDEIRGGAGDDVIDLTSQRFVWDGVGLTLRGGEGDDVIWSNCGENQLFGDSGNDRLVGGTGNDILAGGSGDDRLHGGGGDDIFTFGADWGTDVVDELADGSVTLWFDGVNSADLNVSELDGNTVFSSGSSSVTVLGRGADGITVHFGRDGEDYDRIAGIDAFAGETHRKIFEENRDGMLAVL
ncbi:MAG: hypothetical protein AB7F32_00895 [Victivallaceae bacterium]